MADVPNSPPAAEPIFLAGPTAVGKSEVALALAERIGGEIISVDSMQVYRGMDIGTDKPGREARGRVPHHLIDIVDLSFPFSSADFVRLASEAVAQIQGRGRVPLFCGGTGLYFNAFLEGLGAAPASNPALRAELEATPLPELLDELQRADPVGYARIDRLNPRRVFRAVEILRLTGRPYSAQRAHWQAGPRPQGALPRVFGLNRAQEDRRRRIDARVDEMFRRGLVEETRRLLTAGLAENRTAMQALGYRQVAEHLAGVRGLAETIELVKTRTRQFARRQRTWFRNQLDVHWIEAGPNDSALELAGKVLVLLGKPQSA